MLIAWFPENNGEGDGYSITILLVLINVTGYVLQFRGSILCMHISNFASLNLAELRGQLQQLRLRN
jgi:hypothetical protein